MVIDKPRLPGVLAPEGLSQADLTLPEGGADHAYRLDLSTRT